MSNNNNERSFRERTTDGTEQSLPNNYEQNNKNIEIDKNNQHDNISYSTGALFGFRNEINDSKFGAADEDEKTPTSADASVPVTTSSTVPQEQSKTVFTKKETQYTDAVTIKKIETAVTPKVISNNILLFVCFLLVIIVIFVKNYGVEKISTKIDQISKERLKSLDTLILPNTDSYEKTVSSMVAKELSVTNKNDNDENLYEIVRKGDQVFKFAKDRPTPKQKKHAPRNDIHTLGLDTLTDGYQ
jgi:hypothetical protein